MDTLLAGLGPESDTVVHDSKTASRRSRRVLILRELSCRGLAGLLEGVGTRCQDLHREGRSGAHER